MAIKIKRSTGNAAPAELAAGQLAYSEGATNGGTLYYGEIGGVVREIAGRKFVDKLDGIAAGAEVNTVDSVAGKTGTVTLASTDVTDFDAAVDARITSANLESDLGFTPEDSANKGVANGYASLDSNGFVPSGQLPSYVDDVLEFADLAAFPGTGETGKIYVAIDTAKIYRWSGSVYVEISASPGSTDAVTEGSTNLYFTNARARSAISVSGDLSYDSSTGVISFTEQDVSGFALSSSLATVATSGDYDDLTNAPDLSVFMEELADDAAPSLGGNLDVDGNSIVSTDNGNIVLAPNGTGRVVVQGVAQMGGLAVATNNYTAASSISLNQAHTTADANNINFARSRGTLQSPAAVANGDELFELAAVAHDGSNYATTFEITTTTIDEPSAGFVPSKTEFKVRSSSSVVSTIMEISSNQDGAVAVNGVINLGDAPLVIEGDAGVDITGGEEGDVVIQGLTYPADDGTAGQVLVTDGAGALSFATPSSGVTTFAALSDTPSGFSGSAGFYVKVNSGATALEFSQDVDDGTF